MAKRRTSLLDFGRREPPPLPSILENALQPPPFHENRWLARDRPHRARDRLSGYAVLELKIVKARRLLANNHNLGTVSTSDPYAEIHIDDVFKGKTHKVDLTLDPVWNWSGTFPIKNPASVVLLRVFDFQIVPPDEFLGFVEFPVADMPLNQTICGWFVLSPAGKLEGIATERLQMISTQQVPEVCGAVFLEATLRIAPAGCEADERYAWCLPTPDFKVYDANASRKPLDAQGMIDKIHEIKTIVFYFLRPLLACINIVLNLKDKALSFTVFAAAIFIGFYPFLFLTGIFIWLGVFLLLLSSPGRRKRICAHPSFVPLNDEGYALMAALRETEALNTFLSRVVATMRGKVLDVDRFRQFAAFISILGKPVCAFEELKHQILKASKIDDPFLTCEPLPHAPGTLVKVGASDLGEIVECLNPQEPLAWRYRVVFPQVDGKSVFKEIAGDALETRTDLRWMQTQAVLALIPDVVEDSIEAFHPTLDSIKHSLRKNYDTIASILSWKNCQQCCVIAFGCIALGIICIWLQRTLMVAATIYIFLSGTNFWVSHSRWRAASSRSRQHAAKRFETWPFLKGGYKILPGETSGLQTKQSTQEELEELNGAVSFFEALACCAKKQK